MPRGDEMASSGANIPAARPSSQTAPGSVDSRTGRLFRIAEGARLTDEFWAAVLHRLQTQPVKVVAYEIGCSEAALRMRLSRAGLRTKPRNAEGLQPATARIVDLRRGGASYSEIARTLGVTRNAVAVHLYQARKRGIAI